MNLKNQNINTILSYVKQITVPQLSYLWVQAKDGFAKLSPPIARFINMMRGVLASLIVDHRSLIEPIVDNLVPVGLENNTVENQHQEPVMWRMCDASHMSFEFFLLSPSCKAGWIWKRAHSTGLCDHPDNNRSYFNIDDEYISNIEKDVIEMTKTVKDTYDY